MRCMQINSSRFGGDGCGVSAAALILRRDFRADEIVTAPPDGWSGDLRAARRFMGHSSGRGLALVPPCRSPLRRDGSLLASAKIASLSARLQRRWQGLMTSNRYRPPAPPLVPIASAARNPILHRGQSGLATSSRCKPLDQRSSNGTRAHGRQRCRLTSLVRVARIVARPAGLMRISASGQSSAREFPSASPV